MKTKRFLVLAGVLTAVLAAGGAIGGARELPGGTWTGTAEWSGAGQSGDYRVERTFAGNTMTSNFAWEERGGRTEEATVTFAISGEPMFDVLDPSGGVVGRGYCADHACAYRAVFGKMNLDESFRWTDDALSVLGAKSGPGFGVVWTETLKKQ